MWFPPRSVAGAVTGLFLAVWLPGGTDVVAQTGPLGLPVVEVPASVCPGSSLAVILSGDGGWAAGDKTMAAALADSGVAVVGLDTPDYLRVKRSPDVAAADMTRLLRSYLLAWHKNRLMLVGYSHGADILPFIVSRLPADLRDRIDLVAFLGLEPAAGFEFHVADIVFQTTREGDLPVLPEMQKLHGLRMLCIRGEDEPHSLCPTLPSSLARIETRPGGHRIPGSEGKETADLILDAARPDAH